jgi:hypothetical protein
MFDRFKFKNYCEELSEVKKILNAKDTGYGLQFADKKYIILKYKHKSHWRITCEYYPVNFIIRTEISTKKTEKKVKTRNNCKFVGIPLFKEV